MTDMTFTVKEFRVATGLSDSKSVSVTESDFPGLTLSAPDLSSFEESLAKYITKFLRDYRGVHSYAFFVEQGGPTPVYCILARLTDMPLYWES